MRRISIYGNFQWEFAKYALEILLRTSFSIRETEPWRSFYCNHIKCRLLTEKNLHHIIIKRTKLECSSYEFPRDWRTCDEIFKTIPHNHIRQIKATKQKSHQQFLNAKCSPNFRENLDKHCWAPLKSSCICTLSRWISWISSEWNQFDTHIYLHTKEPSMSFYWNTKPGSSSRLLLWQSLKFHKMLLCPVST